MGFLYATLYFICGVVFSYLIALIGLEFFEENLENFAIVFLFLILLIFFIASLIAFFRKQILTAVFKSADTHIESLIEPIASTTRSVVARDVDSAIDSAKDFVQILIARQAANATRKWIIASVIGLLAGIAGLTTTVLMIRQNQLLTEQNITLEAQNVKIDAQTNLLAEQNFVVKLQTKIAEQSVIPQFTVEVEKLQISDEDIASQDQIIVENHGAVVRELRSKVAVLLHVQLYPEGFGEGQVITSIALNGYYTGTGKRVSGKGQMLRVIGDRNNEHFINLSNSFKAYAESKKMLGLVEIKRFIRLTYRDGLGNFHKEYYKVEPEVGAQILTEKEGQKVYKHFKGVNLSFVEFRSLSAERLYQLASEKRR